MTAEEITKELASLQVQEEDILRRRGELIQALEGLPEEDWDWMSVSAASRMIGRSVTFIYRLVNGGKLESKYIGSCMNVRKSALQAMNDVSA